MGSNKLIKNHKLAKKLLRLQKKIESKKSEITKLKGSLSAYQDELKKQGFKTTGRAREFLRTARREIKNKEKRIKKGFIEVKKLLI